MKLRNKKTGEIVETGRGYLSVPSSSSHTYHSLAELNEEWEDYEESGSYWYITEEGSLGRIHKTWDTEESIKLHKEFGNYFETVEEAEKTLEKLEAWKRLKDKGFKFDGFDVANRGEDNIICGQTYFKAGNYDREEIKSDLDLLFGGGE